MSEETKTEMAKKEYKLVSAIGTFMTALGKGRIYSTITMDEEKMTIQTKPAKKSTIPVLYYEDITDVRVTKKITGYYIFFMLVALLCCFAAPYTIIFGKQKGHRRICNRSKEHCQDFIKRSDKVKIEG